MRSTVAQSVGVDISKDTLDVAIHPGGESFRITNNPEGHRALIKRLKGFDIARIVFEATGPTIACSNRRWSRSACLGSRSIPVRPDASPRPQENLPRLTGVTPLCLPAWAQFSTSSRAPLASKTVEALKELVNARDALIKDRVAALNRQAIAVSPLIKRQLAQRLRQIDGQIEAIDRRSQNPLRNADSDLCQRFDILTSIPGIRRGDRKRARRRDARSSGVSSTPKPPAS